MRIAITGIGAVSALGPGSAALLEALENDPADLDTRPALAPRVERGYEVVCDVAEILGSKGLRLLDRATRLALAAAHLALRDAGIEDATGPPGIVLGTSFGSLSSIAGFIADRLENGPKALNPALFPNTVINSPASQVAIRFGLSTLSSTVTAGWAAGAAAIGYAADLLEQGRAEIVLAGGGEELTDRSRSLYAELGLLAPDGPCLPGSGRGTVLGEGACLLVLEPYDRARARGARGIAELAGRGLGFAPDGGAGGMRRAIREAIVQYRPDLADAPPREWPFDAVVAGACGVAAVDQAEAEALAGFSGPVWQPKRRLGETDGASGALAAAIAALRCQRAERPDQGRIKTVLVTAPSYTGHAAALIVTRHDI